MKSVKALLTKPERATLGASLAADPLAHPVMPRTGGFRKARWGRGNRGKSGGVRVIYYYFVAGDKIFMQDVYSKNEKETLTHDDEIRLQRIAREVEGSKKDKT